jgi:hypothetical protein
MGATSSFFSNAGMQYSTLVANRAQLRCNAFGAHGGVAGATGFKSRGLTIGSFAGLNAGDPMYRITSIGVCPDNAAIPLSGMITLRVPDAFVPSGQSYLPAELEVQLAGPTGPTNSIRKVQRVTTEGETQTLLGVRAGGSDLWVFPAQPDLSLGALWSSGIVLPNNNVLGKVGDLYSYRGGGPGTTLWVKESGNNTDTGWAPK